MEAEIAGENGPGRGAERRSRYRVSALCHDLDERVSAFRQRPLEGAFPYLWLDAKHIGVDIGETETEAFWVEFLRGLVARGLAGVRLAVSDEHQGLKAAIERVLACPPAFAAGALRAQHARPLPPRGLVSAALREIFAAPGSYGRLIELPVNTAQDRLVGRRRSPSDRIGALALLRS